MPIVMKGSSATAQGLRTLTGTWPSRSSSSRPWLCLLCEQFADGRCHEVRAFLGDEVAAVGHVDDLHGVGVALVALEPPRGARPRRACRRAGGWARSGACRGSGPCRIGTISTGQPGAVQRGRTRAPALGPAGRRAKSSRSSRAPGVRGARRRADGARRERRLRAQQPLAQARRGQHRLVAQRGPPVIRRAEGTACCHGWTMLQHRERAEALARRRQARKLAKPPQSCPTSPTRSSPIASSRPSRPRWRAAPCRSRPRARSTSRAPRRSGQISAVLARPAAG